MKSFPVTILELDSNSAVNEKVLPTALLKENNFITNFLCVGFEQMHIA